jgi:tripartite-type tricarboxylate transporter receptor subunit TctC
MKSTLTAFGIALSTLAAATASAQTDWPSKPIKFIVSYPAGGASDQIARVVGDLVSRDLKTPVVVDNRGGASGMIGGAACKGSAPDGYTFCVFLMDVIAANPVLFKSVPYQAERDFVPVAMLTDVNMVATVPGKSDIQNLKDLVQEARTKPATTNWGSWGVGSSAHLVLGAIEKSAGATITHVPYRTTPELLQSVISGDSTGSIFGYSLVHPHMEQKNMRAIAVMGDKRLPFLPNVPTFAEQGVAMKGTFWYGLFAPAGTPERMVTAMNAAVNRAVKQALDEKKLDPQTYTMKAFSQPEFATFVKQETATWGDIARQSGVKLD